MRNEHPTANPYARYHQLMDLADVFQKGMRVTAAVTLIPLLVIKVTCEQLGQSDNLTQPYMCDPANLNDAAVKSLYVIGGFTAASITSAIVAGYYLPNHRSHP